MEFQKSVRIKSFVWKWFVMFIMLKALLMGFLSKAKIDLLLLDVAGIATKFTNMSNELLDRS